MKDDKEWGFGKKEIDGTNGERCKGESGGKERTIPEQANLAPFQHREGGQGLQQFHGKDQGREPPSKNLRNHTREKGQQSGSRPTTEERRLRREFHVQDPTCQGRKGRGLPEDLTIKRVKRPQTSNTNIKFYHNIVTPELILSHL